MRKEDWEVITNNWGSSDENLMEQIAQIKDRDALEYENLNKDIQSKQSTIDDLTRQNIDLNKTNMQLILRLTDPSIPQPEPKPEYVAPNISDYGAFYHG